jgi:hypothetical protein
VQRRVPAARHAEEAARPRPWRRARMCTACRRRRRGLDVHGNVAAWL